MTQPAAIPAQKATDFAHQALKALGFINLDPLLKRSHALQSPLTAGHMQVAVLKCISAMEQVHKALTLERQNRLRTNPNANGQSVNTDPVLFAVKLA